MPPSKIGMGIRLKIARLSDSNPRKYRNQSSPRSAEALAARAMVTGPEMLLTGPGR